MQRHTRSMPSLLMTLQAFAQIQAPWLWWQQVPGGFTCWLGKGCATTRDPTWSREGLSGLPEEKGLITGPPGTGHVGRTQQSLSALWQGPVLSPQTLLPNTGLIWFVVYFFELQALILTWPSAMALLLWVTPSLKWLQVNKQRPFWGS